MSEAEAASGEVLVCFREARNHHDRYGVAIEKNGMILLLTSWLLEPPVRFSIDNGISDERGPLGSGNPSIGTRYLRIDIIIHSAALSSSSCTC